MVHKDTVKVSNTHGGALYYVVEVPLEEYEYEKYEKQRFRYIITNNKCLFINNYTHYYIG